MPYKNAPPPKKKNNNAGHYSTYAFISYFVYGPNIFTWPGCENSQKTNTLNYDMVSEGYLQRRKYTV